MFDFTQSPLSSFKKLWPKTSWRLSDRRSTIVPYADKPTADGFSRRKAGSLSCAWQSTKGIFKPTETFSAILPAADELLTSNVPATRGKTGSVCAWDALSTRSSTCVSTSDQTATSPLASTSELIESAAYVSTSSSNLSDEAENEICSSSDDQAEVVSSIEMEIWHSLDSSPIRVPKDDRAEIAPSSDSSAVNGSASNPMENPALPDFSPIHGNDERAEIASSSDASPINASAINPMESPALPDVSATRGSADGVECQREIAASSGISPSIVCARGSADGSEGQAEIATPSAISHSSGCADDQADIATSSIICCSAEGEAEIKTSLTGRSPAEDHAVISASSGASPAHVQVDGQASQIAASSNAPPIAASPNATPTISLSRHRAAWHAFRGEAFNSDPIDDSRLPLALGVDSNTSQDEDMPEVQSFWRAFDPRATRRENLANMRGWRSRERAAMISSGSRNVAAVKYAELAMNRYLGSANVASEIVGFVRGPEPSEDGSLATLDSAESHDPSVRDYMAVDWIAHSQVLIFGDVRVETPTHTETSLRSESSLPSFGVDDLTD